MRVSHLVVLLSFSFGVLSEIPGGIDDEIGQKRDDSGNSASMLVKREPAGIPKAPGDFIEVGAKSEAELKKIVPPRKTEKKGNEPQGIPKAPSDIIPAADSMAAAAKAEPQGIKKAPSDVIEKAPAAAPAAKAEPQGINKAPSDDIPVAKNSVSDETEDAFKKAPANEAKQAATPAQEQPKKDVEPVKPASGKKPITKEDDIVPDDEEESVTEAKAALAEVELPPSLTIENFDKVVSERLSFVEFYSPYCHHCKSLAPIWEQTFKEFHSEMKKLNIQMRQINCVENGDLCERESIGYYPNLRLYTPKRDPTTKEIIPGQHKNVATFPRSIVKTPENFKKYLKNSVAEYDEGSIDLPSSSELLNSDSMLKIMAGEITEPIFVSFFPQSDEGWKITDESSKNTFISRCVDCLDYKQMWDKLSNQILSTVKTGHFNCMSNEDLCIKLGFQKLTHYDNTWGVKPRLAMFLPKDTGIIRLDYQEDVDIESIKIWTSKLRENYRFEKIKNRALQEILDVKNSLPFQPLNAYYPLANKMALVLVHDEELTDEDRAILPYILDYVTDLPFNINIYTSTDVKLDNYLTQQSKNIIEFINYDQEAKPYEYNLPMHLATTLTSKPTLYLFKENTLVTPIYQNFALEDMRNELKIKEFIEKNQFPLYQELTPALLSTYFPKRFPDKKSKGFFNNGVDDKVVITFINSDDASLTNSALYNISLIAHEYHILKKEYYFMDLINKRLDKKQIVESLLKLDASSGDVVTAMRNEIPHLFENNEVLFTYIDVAKYPELAAKSGWDITGANYTVGDTIVVSRNDKYYWNKDIGGQAQLKNDPSRIKSVLQYLLDPKLVKETDVKVNSLLIGSPYHNYLRFMDIVHAHGFFGYILFYIVIYGAYVGVKKLRRKRIIRLPKSETGLGILGKRID